MNLYESQKTIKTKEDFTFFLELLLNDYKQNNDDWENKTLINFLEALHAYSNDLEGFYSNNDITFDKNNPSWKNFAQILLGAKVYE
jgi:hypothetical protein